MGNALRTPHLPVLKKLVALAICLLPLSCGYRLVGRGTYLPEYVHIVGVPTFQNKTTRVAIEQVVTDAVVHELERRGNFEVVSRQSNVDAILAGSINSFSLVPVGFAPDGRANRFQVVVSGEVALLDARAQKVIYQNPYVTYRDDFQQDFANTSAENSDLFFDREPETVEAVAKEFAENVVITILEGF